MNPYGLLHLVIGLIRTPANYIRKPDKGEVTSNQLQHMKKFVDWPRSKLLVQINREEVR